MQGAGGARDAHAIFTAVGAVAGVIGQAGPAQKPGVVHALPVAAGQGGAVAAAPGTFAVELTHRAARRAAEPAAAFIHAAAAGGIIRAGAAGVMQGVQEGVLQEWIIPGQRVPGLRINGIQGGCDLQIHGGVASKDMRVDDILAL